MRNIITTFLFIIILLASVIVENKAQAQISTTPSPAQIEQFKKLPKQQQMALAQQFGIDLGQIQSMSSQPSSTFDAEKPEQKYLDKMNQKGELPLSDPWQAFGEETEEELKPFGYDMFEQLQDAFLPGGSIPVPADYLVGPGDTIEVNLYGKASSSYTVTINNEGQIYIPELEPLNVAGLTFVELKNYIAQAVEEKTIGYTSAVAISNLRSIQVYVVGDVKRPGAYNLSSLSTITNALFISGGPTLIGSLRNIHLKRAGKTISKLDLYQVFTAGDVSQDLRLQQGDVIFVDGVKNQVSVTGEVRRPAIFEVVESDNVNSVVKYAGGLTMKGYPKNVVYASFDQNYQRQVSAVDLTQTSQKAALKNGDVITVLPVSEQFSDVIHIAGAVARPGIYTWREGLALGQLINGQDDVLATTDLGYGLILRKNQTNNYQVEQFQPAKVIAGEKVNLNAGDLVVFFSQFEQATYEIAKTLADDFPTNPNLKALDFELTPELNLPTLPQYEEVEEVENNFIYDLQHGDLFAKQKALAATKLMGRGELLQPIVQLLTASQQGAVLVPVVEINGQVRFPGVYPLAANSGLEKIVKAAGGLTESANLERGEISRVVELADFSKSTQHLSFNLTNPEWKSIAVSPRDVINIFQKANWQDEQKVELSGEVLYPGIYTIKEGESLAEVLQRAGGLTRFAAPGSAFFTRESLKLLEQQQAQNMARNLSKELAFKSISSSYSNVNIGEVQLLVNKLTTVEGVGRLVIDLPSVLDGTGSPIKLENGDKLHVPSFRNEVNIIGEVQVATTHLFDASWSLEDYLNSSGGLRQQADDDRIYIIRANGLVDVPDSSWFGDSLTIRPGDTIVVPLDAGYTDRLTLWEKATSIFYQLTVGLAALGRI